MYLADIPQACEKIHVKVHASVHEETLSAHDLSMAAVIVELSSMVAALAKEVKDLGGRSYQQHSGFFYNGRSY